MLLEEIEILNGNGLLKNLTFHFSQDFDEVSDADLLLPLKLIKVNVFVLLLDDLHSLRKALHSARLLGMGRLPATQVNVYVADILPHILQLLVKDLKQVTI